MDVIKESITISFIIECIIALGLIIAIVKVKAKHIKKYLYIALAVAFIGMDIYEILNRVGLQNVSSIVFFASIDIAVVLVAVRQFIDITKEERKLKNKIISTQA